MAHATDYELPTFSPHQTQVRLIAQATAGVVCNSCFGIRCFHFASDCTYCACSESVGVYLSEEETEDATTDFIDVPYSRRDTSSSTDFQLHTTDIVSMGNRE